MKSVWRKIFKIGGALFAIALIAFAAVIIYSEYDKTLAVKYIKNDDLPTIKSEWTGNPVDEKDRFVNEEFPYLPKLGDLLKWQFSGNPQKQEKINDEWRLEVREPGEFLQSEKNGILWLGHAGFFIRVNGVNIIIDPVFGKPPLIKTYVDVSSPLDKIKKIDYILLSHDHRDHTDQASIEELTKKFPEATILAGLKMDDILNEWKTPTNKLQMAGWYQQFVLPDERLKIFFLPARHWTRRGLFDTNQRLWGAFVIQSPETTIYFGGDSGFDSHYKKLGELFPKINYFIAGIGAYRPIWFMKPNHNAPEEAWQGFLDAKADYFIPMHYGRFDLSDEPPSEPLRLLRKKAAETNAEDKIKFLQINENLKLSN